MANLTAYTVRHWGENGEGTGISLVVASSEQTARWMLKEYLLAKPEGHRQYSRLDLFEVEVHAESDLANEPVDTSKPGVVREYHYPSMERPSECKLVYMSTPPQELADQLDALQANENGGRGVSCVRSIMFYLRRNDLTSARAVALNDGDKIRSYPKIVEALRRVGFCYEVDWNRL